MLSNRRSRPQALLRFPHHPATMPTTAVFWKPQLIDEGFQTRNRLELYFLGDARPTLWVGKRLTISLNFTYHFSDLFITGMLPQRASRAYNLPVGDFQPLGPIWRNGECND